MASQVDLLDSLNGINSALFSLASHFISQSSIASAIIDFMNVLETSASNTTAEVQESVANLGIINPFLEEVQFLNISSDTNDAELISSASTYACQISNSSHDYQEGTAAVSSGGGVHFHHQTQQFWISSEKPALF